MRWARQVREAGRLPRPQVSGAGFSLEGACPLVLRAGEACVFSLVFAPRETSHVRRIPDMGGECREVLGTARLKLALLFWTHLALSGERLDLEMRVAGPLPVRLGRASASGGEVVEDRCANRRLASGEACRVGIRLAGVPGPPVLARLEGAAGTFPLSPASAGLRSEGSAA